MLASSPNARRATNRWALGCIGAVSILAIACSIGWYVAFVRYARDQVVDRAAFDGGEVLLHRRRTLPGGDAYMLEHVDAAGRVRWIQTFGEVTDIAGLRVHTDLAWVTLDPVGPRASERLGFDLADGLIRARVAALHPDASVMEWDGDFVETWAGTARRVSSRDGSVV